MIDIELLADPARCPDCAGGLNLPRPAYCEHCGLPLAGPLALALWKVSGDARRVLEQREALLRQLRATAAPRWSVELGTARYAAAPAADAEAPAAAAAPAAGTAAGSGTGVGAGTSSGRHAAHAGVPRPTPPSPAFGAAADGPSHDPYAAFGRNTRHSAAAAAAPARPADPEVTRRRIARFFLGTGVLLLIVAAIVFVAVTWQRSGTVGRAVVMALMLVAFATGAAVAERRELPLTAEALGAVSVAMGLLDGYAAWAADLAGLRGVDAMVATAATLGAVGGAAWAGSRVLGLKSLRISAALLLQAPIPLLAGRIGIAQDSVLPLAVGFALQAVGEIALLRWAFRTGAGVGPDVVADGRQAEGGVVPPAYLPESPAVRIALIGAVAYWLAAFGLCFIEAGGGAAGGVMLFAAVAAACSARLMHRFTAIRHAAAGAAATSLYAAVLLAGAALPRQDDADPLPLAWGPAFLGLLTLAMVGLVHVLPRAYRPGPVAVLTVPFAVSAVTAVLAVAATLGPVAWLTQPWTGDPELSGARALLTPERHWAFGAATLLAVPVCALIVLAWARLSGPVRWWRTLAAAGVAAEAAVLPASLDFPLPVAVGYVMAAGAAGIAASRFVRLPDLTAAAVRGAGIVLFAVGAAWSLARPGLSVAAFGAAAAFLVAAVWLLPAAWRPGTAGVATAQMFVWVALTAHWADVAAPVYAAGITVLAAVVAVGAAVGLRRGASGTAGSVLAVAAMAAIAGLMPAAERPAALAVAFGALAAAMLIGTLVDGGGRAPAWAALATASASACAATTAHWAEVAGPVIGAGIAVADALVVVVAMAAQRRRPTICWAVVPVAAVAAVAGTIAAGGRPGSLGVALGALAVASWFGAVADDGPGKPVWAVAGTAATLGCAGVTGSWAGVDTQALGAGLAVLACALIVGALFVQRRHAVAAWAALPVAGAAVVGGTITAAPEIAALAVGFAALAVAAAFGTLVDAAERRPAWAVLWVGATVSGTAAGADAAGAEPVWTAFAAAVVAALFLAAAPPVRPRKVSLVKGAYPYRAYLTWAFEAASAGALVVAGAGAPRTGWAQAAFCGVVAVAAATRVPEGRSAVRTVWAPVVVAAVAAGAATSAYAGGWAGGDVALTLIAVSGVLMVLSLQVPQRLVPELVPSIAVLGLAQLGGLAALGTYPEREWIGLAVAGAAAALVAGLPTARPDARQLRLPAAAVAVLALLGAYWMRMALADVTAPEAYTVPPALLVLGAGLWLRRTRDPKPRSWPALGPGLVLALVPPLPLAVANEAALRPALLGAAAFATLVLGARHRLQAPLLLGSLTLSAIAVFQLSSPVIAAYHALPRYVVLGGAGLALLAIGIGYERQLRNLARLGRAVRRLS
ncbi:SCO7613 C-terminal domain-containing membrane protein [Yinghuangia soli]|uniref:DUF2157 domain-containing protein n=1 Tax=Yinghuangia soli TaxID=2908204 RepID=A0AA41Q050_9ACTN|nr:hypothetical protein [Yinghuangia soli]MCF2529105.1 hypothetical protein [Yinghuangia soli]